ncbi:MAG: von Willebrand factor type A domain-containing protein [Planctomycetota bacterium]
MTNETYEPGATNPDELRDELLTAYLLHELDAVTRARLAAELAEDAELEARRRELEAALRFVESAGGQDALSGAAVASLLNQARLQVGRRRGWRSVPPSILSAAAGVVLLVGAGLLAKGFFGADSSPASEVGSFAYRIFGETASRSDGYAGPGDSVPPSEGRKGAASVAPSPAPNPTASGGGGFFLGMGKNGSPAGQAGLQFRAGSEVKTLTRGVEVERLRTLGYLGESASSEGEVSPSVGFYYEPSSEPHEKLARLREELSAKGELQADDFDSESYGRARVTFVAESFEALVAGYLGQCCVLPGESAADMFFRYWGDHPFVRSADDALSTFAADADTSSYALARNYLRKGELPPREAVRTEEFVNYFTADVPPPTNDTFDVRFELAPSAFHPDPDVWMLRVAVRGKDLPRFERQPLALTFVVDVSGSMQQGGRLDLVKQALALLATELTPGDSVALIAFSTEARQLLPMTSAANRAALEDVLVSLEPTGGTNVQAGLGAGFRAASDGLVPGAVNRVVFLSDGVGNIGATDQRSILDEVETMRARGIYLNTIGVGMGNVNDDFLEQLADRGDGVANYIDTVDEAERVMVYEFTNTFQPIARDVKIQLEFDPRQVREWRQLGYENRALAHADFRNDAVDAGELNAGHQVSALYELVRTGAGGTAPLATCRLRWKEPFAVDTGDASERATRDAEVATERLFHTTGEEAAYELAGASWGFRRSLVAAQLAECLRRSKHARADDPERLKALATDLARERPNDPEVVELGQLVELAVTLLAGVTPETDERTRVLDAIAERRYLEARLEQLGATKRDPADAAAARGEIEALERRLREIVAAEVGYDLAASDDEPNGEER